MMLSSETFFASPNHENKITRLSQNAKNILRDFGALVESTELWWPQVGQLLGLTGTGL